MTMCQYQIMPDMLSMKQRINTISGGERERGRNEGS